jgi:predicted ATPase
LHDRLDSHAGEPSALPRRQQTLESLIGWSYALLSPKEQMLFRRLSVFVGGFTLHATEAVCRGDGLESWELSDLLARLGEKSLVEPDVGARPVTDKARFRMLDTIREFAGKKLGATGEASALSARHAAYFAALAEEASPHLKGAGQLQWLATLDADHDNLRRALDAFGAPDADPEAGLRFVCALDRYWTTRGYAAEAQRYLDAMLSRSGAATAARGHALNAAGNRCLSAGDPEKADRLYDEALRIGREIGDAAVVARSVHNKGGVALSAGHFAEARAWFQECLAMDRERGDRFGEGTVLSNLGLVAERKGDLAEARGLYEASLAIQRVRGHGRPRMADREVVDDRVRLRGRRQRHRPKPSSDDRRRIPQRGMAVLVVGLPRPDEQRQHPGI